MSGHGKARDDKRKKRIRHRRNAAPAQAHQVKVAAGQSPVVAGGHVEPH